mmetsp:Transcript_536/g.901  ORF Transcript_536/g.901 Transcript_536/m.901 type:complete len:815 (-) Transcript_536:65-2509(-)|eukprot:CAMPEP_0170069590 /NCGR_PEP_ID=MMETSP0019_2-20121128/8206_1 /TAXON_ID=98059 /ORGANISM="Dinobryon sp., Strain UTEXLB2267" /LENGTH=814 /DNA_ID=CAMNT_0010277669 /DNA_START=51 /DNA_END=2495 /DNA_ORIENTATION=+
MNNVRWEGRVWINSENNAVDSHNRSFSVVSYHLLADSKITSVNYSTTRNWDLRSLTILQEIRSYLPDVLCLQDVDHFAEWWRPQLMLLGYDTVYKQRTEIKDFRSEGVAIAYKSDKFQLFKTVNIEFNQSVQDNERGSIFIARSITDDVGLILFLQPYQNESTVKSALCIVSAMLSDNAADSDVRMVQCQYLAQQVERYNRDFQSPVVIGMSMHDSPSSLAYNLLRTGRIPLLAQVPKKCRPPYGSATCRGSVLLKWLPPPTSLADPPILDYRIIWRPGGSRVLGYNFEKKVSVGDCVKYAKHIDADNNVKIYALPELQCIIAGLSSDVPYEFRIAAVNEMGEGVLSEPSEPIVMPNSLKAPVMPALVSFNDLITLNESREQVRMKSSDFNVQVQFKIDEAVNPATQTTPRTVDGRKTLHVPVVSVLPVGTNPRSGWKSSLGGTKSEVIQLELAKESVLSKSLLRNRTGFVNALFNSYSETLDVATTDKMVDNQHHHDHSNNDDIEEGESLEDSNKHDKEKVPDSDSEFELFQTNDNGAVVEVNEQPNSTSEINNDTNTDLQRNEVENNQTSEESLDKIGNNVDIYGSGDFILDGRECLEHIGVPNPRQVHNLSLRSAYESYSVSGEPLFTASWPVSQKNLQLLKKSTADNSQREGIQCMDYIFYSSHGLQLEEYLSLPLLSDLRGETPAEPISTVDLTALEPFTNCKGVFDERLQQLYGEMRLDSSKMTSHSKHTVNEFKKRLKDKLQASHEIGGSNMKGKNPQFWGGKWSPLVTQNADKTNHFLPNDDFCSSHLAIGAKFSINNALLSSQWR